MSLAHKKPQIAIIGGGPAGLVAAKSLLEESLQPVVFEQSSALGGQWHAPASHSGVWSSMRTNTSKVTTCCSDFPLADHLPMFPTNQQMHAYLQRCTNGGPGDGGAGNAGGYVAGSSAVDVAGGR